MGGFDVTANMVVPDDEGDPDKAREFRKKWRWDPHEVVILRGSFEGGDHEAVNNASIIANKKGEPVFKAGSGRMALLDRMIVDWTITQNGRKVPITPQTIRKLKANYITPLLEVCDALAAGMSEEEQEDFFDTANGSSSTNPIEMSPYLKQS